MVTALLAGTLAATFACLAPQGGALAFTVCASFEFPLQTRETIFALSAPAVIRITAGGKTGTGFVIDGRRGYIATAAHVVDTGDEVRGFFDQDPVGHKLRLVESLAPRSDVALLQFESSPAVPLASLQLAFRPSRLGAALYTAGYSSGTLHRQEVRDLAPVVGGRVEVSQPVFPGDSGSPLIDERGQVVAICVERKPGQVNDIGGGSTMVAYYLPAVALLPLLEKLPVSDVVKDWHGRLLNSQVTQSQLATALSPALPTFSNVDLLGWVLTLRGAAWPTGVRALIQCPLLIAAIDRRLGDAVLLLASGLAPVLQKELSGEVRALALEGQAVREQWLGNLDRSRVLTDQALEYRLDALKLRPAIGDSVHVQPPE